MPSRNSSSKRVIPPDTRKPAPAQRSKTPAKLKFKKK